MFSHKLAVIFILYLLLNAALFKMYIFWYFVFWYNNIYAVLLFIYLLLKFLNAFIFYLKKLKGSEQTIVISQANRVNPCCARIERRITSQFSEEFIFEPIWLLKQRTLCRTSIMMKSDWWSKPSSLVISKPVESIDGLKEMKCIYFKGKKGWITVLQGWNVFRYFLCWILDK